jgi:hypothetical protein
MVLKERDADGDDGATAGIDSARRSIDEGWASLTSGSDRGPDDDRADGSEPAVDELQAAYDAATRRAAEWYSSRLEDKSDEKRRGQHGPTRHVSRPGVPAAPDDRTRRAARVDR